MRTPRAAPDGAMAPRRAPGVAEARILALLTSTNRPISAYDIVHRCNADGDRIAPAQVYRVLARLMAQGRVFRVETLAAYMLPQGPFDLCLICDGCHAIQLLPCPDLAARLAAQAERLGFSPARFVIESRGRCAECATALQ